MASIRRTPLASLKSGEGYDAAKEQSKSHEEVQAEAENVMGGINTQQLLANSAERIAGHVEGE